MPKIYFFDMVSEIAKIGIRKGFVWGALIGAICGLPIFIVGAIWGIGVGSIFGPLTGLSAATIWLFFWTQFLYTPRKRKSTIGFYVKFLVFACITVISSVLITLLGGWILAGSLDFTSTVSLSCISFPLSILIIGYLSYKYRDASANRHISWFVKHANRYN